jgi:hypothetical protein
VAWAPSGGWRRGRRAAGVDVGRRRFDGGCARVGLDGGCAGDARLLRWSRRDHAATPLAMRRPDSIKAYQRMARWRHQRRQACEELHGRHESHLVGVFESVTDLAVVEHGEPLEREGRTSAVAEQAFACGGQPSGHADAGVEIELQVLCAQALCRLRQRANSRCSALPCSAQRCSSPTPKLPCRRSLARGSARCARQGKTARVRRA